MVRYVFLYWFGVFLDTATSIQDCFFCGGICHPICYPGFLCCLPNECSSSSSRWLHKVPSFPGLYAKAFLELGYLLIIRCANVTRRCFKGFHCMQHIHNIVSSMHLYSHLLVDPFGSITSYVDPLFKLGLFVLLDCLLKGAFIINARLVVIDRCHDLIWFVFSIASVPDLWFSSLAVVSSKIFLVWDFRRFVFSSYRSSFRLSPLEYLLSVVVPSIVSWFSCWSSCCQKFLDSLVGRRSVYRLLILFSVVSCLLALAIFIYLLLGLLVLFVVGLSVFQWKTDCLNSVLTTSIYEV